MEAFRLHRWGKPTVTTMTIIEPVEARDPLRPSTEGSSAELFERRVRQARRHPSTYVGPMPLIETGTTYKDLCAKYAADIAAGRELQRRMFGKRG